MPISYGFFSLGCSGHLLHVPQLAGIEFPSANLCAHTLWVAALGILFIIVPLAIGGIVQGFNLQDASLAFSVFRRARCHLRASTMGDLLLAAVHVIFFLNVV